VHLVMDNYGTHKVAKVRSWLARHPRYHVHFTPTSSGCEDLAWALTLAYGMWGERNDGNPLYLYNGDVLTGFNSFGHSSATYEQTVASFGDSNTFYGVPESYVSDTIPPPIRRPRPIRPPRPSPPRPPR